MDNMLGENKNLKDSTTSNMNIAVRDNSTTITYTKTNKLITALFMVTDIMDKEEPLRNKLRILGSNIVSDIHLIQQNNTGHNPAFAIGKIAEVLSFLDISFSVGMISEMNSSILKKEFIELSRSITELISKKNPAWLDDFIKGAESFNEYSDPVLNKPKINNINSIGHINQTRIGVQKGSTLMKALSDKVSHLSIKKVHSPVKKEITPGNQNYDILKKRRRDEITSIIRNKLSVMPDSGGATITDIKNSAEGPLVSCGEKTLQRELVSMVRDGVLKKSGEKRWSKYFI